MDYQSLLTSVFINVQFSDECDPHNKAKKLRAVAPLPSFSPLPPLSSLSPVKKFLKRLERRKRSE